jgi:E3 ubiquitin-protein ligase HUWE1
VLWTLHFTTLLIEHSFSRHLYSSMEHLSLLLSSFDLDVVLAVLNLLYMFSKRSNFISRLAPDKRQLLLSRYSQNAISKITNTIVRLSHLAASWGGKDNGFGLSVCCSDEPITAFPSSATTLHFEFYAEGSREAGPEGARRGGGQSTRSGALGGWGQSNGGVMHRLFYIVPSKIFDTFLLLAQC